MQHVSHRHSDEIAQLNQEIERLRTFAQAEAGRYLSKCNENARLRTLNDEMREALEPCAGWLRYAYGHVASVTADKVKAHLPKIDAVLSKTEA